MSAQRLRERALESDGVCGELNREQKKNLGRFEELT